MSEFYKKIMQREAFKNLLIILAVYGVQLVIFKDVFRCPCRNHKSYGMTFLLIPAVFLLALSLIVCRRSWSVVTTIFKHANYKTRCNFFLSSLVVFFRPLLAPALWIIVALLRGECYVCIRVGSGKDCISDVQKKTSMDYDHYYSQSFILGAGCLVSMVIFATGIVCIQRCCTNSYEYLPTYDDFVKAKKNAIELAFKSKANELANDHAEKIVENSFCDRLASEMDVDETFIQAREKVQAIRGGKPASGFMIDFPFRSMEMTSTSTTS